MVTSTKEVIRVTNRLEVPEKEALETAHFVIENILILFEDYCSSKGMVSLTTGQLIEEDDLKSALGVLSGLLESSDWYLQ